MAVAIGPSCKHEVIGIRPGEKIHEEMITASDSLSTVDIGKYYAIIPATSENNIKEYCNLTGGKVMPKGFSYNSGTNPDFLTVDQIRTLIKSHITSDFIPF